jgi:hypothetical protein
LKERIQARIVELSEDLSKTVEKVTDLRTKTQSLTTPEEKFQLIRDVDLLTLEILTKKAGIAELKALLE